MNKKQIGLRLPGIVQQCLSNGMFLVELENGFKVIVYLSGRIRRNLIRIVLHDEVIVELSPYDLSRGRILYRLTQRKRKDQKKNEKKNKKKKKNRSQ